MKRLIIILLAVLSFSASYSQRLFFVYLQTDPAQPFFVKIQDKIQSSTANGYLILARLKDSSYAITVGFPENKWPDQKFIIDMRSRDHGYTIKNFGEKGWGLFDIENMSIQMSSGTKGVTRTEPKEVSLFTEILSKAANDPSLKEQPVAVNEEKPAIENKDKLVAAEERPQVKEEKPPMTISSNETAKIATENKNSPDSNADRNDVEPAVKKDTVIGLAREDSLPPPALPVVEKEEAKDTILTEYKPSTVVRKSESSVTDGLHLTFIDTYADGKKDTIRIVIPNPKTNTEVKETTRPERKFLDIRSDDTLKKEEPVPAELKTDSTKLVNVSKGHCTTMATENDFLKVRKKMAAETNDEAMIAEAKKFFKAKCYTAEQVKNLSTLFPGDSGKYKFFDAAYEYVSDPGNFATLSSELKDEYYLTRFKAMLR